MTSSPTQTLLALLLSLEAIETPLSADEQARLKTVGQQLALDPDDWDWIAQGLLATIQDNAALNQCFENARSRLKAAGPLPVDLMPAAQEVAALQAGQRCSPPTFGFFEGEPERESDEILNVAMSVLTAENPVQTSKTLGFLEKIRTFLRRSSEGSPS